MKIPTKEQKVALERIAQGESEDERGLGMPQSLFGLEIEDWMMEDDRDKGELSILVVTLRELKFDGLIDVSKEDEFADWFIEITEAGAGLTGLVKHPEYDHWIFSKDP